MNKGLEIDTTILNDASTDLLNELAEIEIEINNFFKKLNSIPESGEWTGPNAEKYANLVIQDKEDYLSYIEGLKELAQQMKDFSENTENAINQSQSEFALSSSFGYNSSSNFTGNKKAQNNINFGKGHTPYNQGYSSSPQQSVTQSNTTLNNNTSSQTSTDINLDKYEQSIHTKKNASNDTVSTAGQITTDNQKYSIVPDAEYKGERGTISESDYNLLIAQVSGESANSPDDMLGVTSTVLNRLEAGNGFGDSVNDVLEKGYFPWGRTYENYVEGGKYYNTDWGQEKLAQVTEVVNDALNGVRNINGDVYYYSGNGEYNKFSDKA